MIIQSKIEIESEIEKIFNILVDGMNFPKWNPAVDNIIRVQSAVEKKTFFLKTAVGNITVIDFEFLKNKSITWHMENSAMNLIGYLIFQNDDIVEVTLWVDVDDLKNKDLFLETQEFALEGLKHYAEFLEEGGNPEEYDKREVLVSLL